MKRVCLVLAVCSLHACLPTVVLATLRPVPSGYDDIYLAMNASTSGDVIQVQAEYTSDETAVIRVKSGVTIETDFSYGSSPAVINSSADSAFSFPAATYSGTTTLRNLTITGFGYTAIKLKAMGGSGTIVIQDCTIEGGLYGIEGYVQSTDVTMHITGNTFSTQYSHAMWIQDAPSTFTIESNYMVDCGGAGIALEGGVPVVTGNTINNCDAGIITAGFITGAPTASRNLVMNCTNSGIGCLSSFATLLYNNSYNNSPNYSDSGCNSISLPTYNLSSDPLVCSGDITLHVNSPCAPANNSFAVLIGARGIACANGNLTNTSTLSSTNVEASGITVTSDFKIPYGKVLTIDDDVTLRFDANGGSNLGVDNTKNELIVAGYLDITGSSGHRAVFKGTTDTEGSWYGIDGSASYGCDVDYAEVKNAVYGIKVMDVGTSTVSHSLFTANSNTDVVIGSADYTLSATVSDNTIEVGDTGTGVEFLGLYGGATVTGSTVSGNTVTATTNALRGIKTGTGTSGSSPAISGNTISGFSNGDGIRVDNGANPTITGNSISSCKQGIYVANGAPLIGTSSSSSDNTLTSNTSGIYVTGSSAAPVVRNNQIHSNTYGVNKKTTSSPDLGVGGDLGKNNLSGNNTYCIFNQTGGGIPAVGNYWGVCNPGPPSCTYGGVIGDSAFCSEPAAARGVAVEPARPEKPLFVRAVTPNPTRGSSVIGFVTTGGLRTVEARVFDVAGQLVRLIGQSVVSDGYHEVSWDGNDATGRAVSNGLYLISMRSDGADAVATRILVVR